MSVCLAMCRGTYYEKLIIWSFQGVFEICMLGQGNVCKPYKQITVTIDNNNNDCFNKRLPTASSTAVTILCFISLDGLMTSENPWVKNDFKYFESIIIKNLYPTGSTSCF